MSGEIENAQAEQNLRALEDLASAIVKYTDFGPFELSKGGRHAQP
jgi:hypothetical protein